MNNRKKFDPKKESHPMQAEDILIKLQELSVGTKAIILSGGEPTLQQKGLIALLKLLKELGDLKTAGILTEEEFTEKKKEVIEDLEKMLQKYSVINTEL